MDGGDHDGGAAEMGVSTGGADALGGFDPSPDAHDGSGLALGSSSVQRNIFKLGTVREGLILCGCLDKDRCGKSHDRPGSRLVRMPGVFVGKDMVQILHWPHSEIQLESFVNLQLKRAGLVDIGHVQPDLTPKSTIDTTISNTSEFDGNAVDAMPSLWHADISGTTLSWSAYWQLPESATRQLLEVKNDMARRTYLLVVGKTWRYSAYRDCETRIAFKVVTHAVYHWVEWMKDDSLVKRYRNIALAVARNVEKMLTMAKPEQFSCTMRDIATRSGPPCPPLPCEPDQGCATQRQPSGQANIRVRPVENPSFTDAVQIDLGQR